MRLKLRPACEKCVLFIVCRYCLIPWGVAVQFSLFGDDQDSRGNEPIDLTLPEASVHYYPSWLTGSEASNFRLRLETELPWVQDTIKLFG